MRPTDNVIYTYCFTQGYFCLEKLSHTTIIYNKAAYNCQSDENDLYPTWHVSTVDMLVTVVPCVCAETHVTKNTHHRHKNTNRVKFGGAQRSEAKLFIKLRNTNVNRVGTLDVLGRRSLLKVALWLPLKQNCPQTTCMHLEQTPPVTLKFFHTRDSEDMSRTTLHPQILRRNLHNNIWVQPPTF